MGDLDASPPLRPARAVAGERALVLCNEKAGSVMPGDADRLRALLAAHGFKYIETADFAALDAAFFERAQAHDVIVVLGGDGTARAAAEAAPAHGPP